MNPLLLSAIRELKNAHGIALDPLVDLQHILTLKELADRVIHVQKDIHAEALLHPVRYVPGVTLRRLSIGAHTFLQDEVAEWYAPESPWTAYSFAYCHAHVDTPAGIWEHMGSPRTWKKALKRWKKTLECSDAELFTAVVAFQNETDDLDDLLQRLGEVKKPDPEANGEAGSGNMGSLVELLSATYSAVVPEGMTPAEYWIWKVPMDEVGLFATAYLDRTDMEDRKKELPGKHSSAQDPDKTYIRAHRALKMYVQKIVDKKKGGENAVGE